jgi:hypothetical protein
VCFIISTYFIQAQFVASIYIINFFVYAKLFPSGEGLGVCILIYVVLLTFTFIKMYSSSQIPEYKIQ